MNQSEANNSNFNSSISLSSIGAKITLLVLSVIVMFLFVGVIGIFAAINMHGQADDQAVLISTEFNIIAGHRTGND